MAVNYLCNPVNVDYRFQFHNADFKTGCHPIAREAADPSMIEFKGTYYIFASMSLEVWASKDLAVWTQHRLPDTLPLYDYAPDVRVVGDYVYFCASKRGEICDFYRTGDIINGPYEKIEGTFDFWDPDLFLDEDGRLYFYWGCSNTTPIWGVELDRETMKPLTEPKELIHDHADKFGFERSGEDNTKELRTPEEAEQEFRKMMEAEGKTEEDYPAELRGFLKSLFTNRPFIEGAWMTKHGGTYYLQYACPGTEYNTYADGVYESRSPLGPFTPAKNNPYSLKPGGFIPGAGHGSTLEDLDGNFWHTATMRISMNHSFERRVGIWPAGFDKDGVMYCDQRFGDWPLRMEGGRFEAWQKPEWYLLSYKKEMEASSETEGKSAALAADENVQTWWQAATNEPGEWLKMDLGEEKEVHAIQVNFADDAMDLASPGEIRGGVQGRYIEEAHHRTRWILEGSADGETYVVLQDKSEADTNLPHDFFVLEKAMQLRYLKLTVFEVPYNQKPCVSGMRVFGFGNGSAPEAAKYEAIRTGTRDMTVRMEAQEHVTGYVILWGFAPDKLYHSRMTFAHEQPIGSLVEGQTTYVRVDAFNENGVTEGTEVLELKA